MKRNILLVAGIFMLIGWSCSKNDSQMQSQPQGLKQSIEKNVADINTAISKISATKGYQILVSGVSTTGKAMVTSPNLFNDSITLALIAGIYDYQPDSTLMHHHFAYPFRLFKKTGTSNLMIVNLPQKLIFHPGYLHMINYKDFRN